MKSVPALLVLVIATHGAIAQEKPAVTPETLRGRPLAEVNPFLYGSSLTHKWMSFYFALEQPDGSVKPIEIAYAFYHSDQLPPESFWDYSKLYEINVRREHGCDTKVEDLAYVKNTTEDGKKLPQSFVLRFAKDAPRGLLKEEAVLPCYVLWYGDYREVSAQTIPAVLLHGGSGTAAGTGAIHGVIVTPDGQPAKGITVTAFWLGPDILGTHPVEMSTTTTNEAGVYRFEPVTFGNYEVFVGYLPIDLLVSPPAITATPLSDTTVELSLDHREAEVRFEVCKPTGSGRLSISTGSQGRW
jgi:hypothetical protein